MATVKKLAHGLTVVDCEPDGMGMRLRARLQPSRREDERGRVYLSFRGTDMDGARQLEVFGYATPDDAVALAQELLRQAGAARRQGKRGG